MLIDFDALLCHHLADEAAAERIRARLAASGLRVRADEWNLQPGFAWPGELDRELDRSAACLLLDGGAGPLPWEHPALAAALVVRSGEGTLRPILALLPGARDDAAPLPFAARVIDARAGLSDAAFAALEAAACGFPPPLAASPRPIALPADARGIHTLRPAPDFMARPALAAIRRWWRRERGVLALSGPAGAGKTALAARFAAQLGADPALPPAQAVFAWSFADQPDLELCLQELHRFFTGAEATTQPARAVVARLLELAAWHPGRILLIFDGLDALQDAPGERALGLLRDSSLRHLARGLAQGAPGVRLLLTSRGAPPELRAAPRFRELPVAGLPAAAARKLLRRRGVRGAPAPLDRLAAAAGSALEIDLLGGLIGASFAGDPAAIERLPPAGSLLERIGAFHAATLPEPEQAVMRMLSLAGDPVQLDAFVSILKARPNQAPDQKVPAFEESAITQAIETLKLLRLITAYGEQPLKLSLSHPPIATALAPVDKALCDDLQSKASATLLMPLLALKRLGERQAMGERLVMHLLHNGNAGFAFTCYAGSYGLDYIPLAWGAADYRRGLRLTAALVEASGIDLENNRNTRPWLHRALYLLDLGRPAEAETQLRRLLDNYRAWSDEIQVLRRRMDALNREDDADEWQRIHDRIYRRPHPGDDQLSWLYYEASLLQSLGDALFAQGRLPEAEALADEVIGGAAPEFWRTARYPLRDTGANPFGRRALARAMRGDSESALEDFEAAAEFDRRLQDGALRAGGPGGAYYVAFHALLLARLGKPATARRLLAGSALAATAKAPLLEAQHRLALAEIHLALGEPAAALHQARLAGGWARDSGQQEVACRAALARARALLRMGQRAAAPAPLAEAERIARGCGFRVWLADALAVAGHVALEAGDDARAVALAGEAATISAAPECDYGWGRGAALHLLAAGRAALGEREAAHALAERAYALRGALRDPRRRNTARLLEDLERAP